MKVSISWLKELVDLKIPFEELIKLLPLRTIGLKEITENSIELDMKGYNRADLLSLRGVAKEIAAISNSQATFTEPEESEYIWESNNFSQLNVEIKNPELCGLYCVAKIENLNVQPSSTEWIKKLSDSGIRPVNNIADATNLIMMEYGQPLHAFDQQQVANETVIVRTAKKDEVIKTLDGKERKLKESDLLITDSEKAIGIAGVMGGENSEVTNSTTTILLEAAIFDAVNLRNTASRLGLNSEASKRFQHGLAKKRLLQAFNAAIKMYESLGGKLTAVSLVGNLEDQTKTIKLSQEKINSLIGIDIKPNAIESSLEKLGFKLSHILSGNTIWEVQVPYWRLDINIEEDLVEEIARMYGYEIIPAKPLIGNIPKVIQNPLFGLIEELKKALLSLGLTEVQTYSFYSTQVLNNFGFNKDKLIKLLNPMSAETEILKSQLWPNLLEVTAKNIRNGIKDIAIFEIGKVYSIKAGGSPQEEYRLSIALSNETDNPIQELNQISQRLSNLNLGQKETLIEKKYLHPIRQTDYMAEIHPRFVNKFKIEQRVAVLEITVTP